MMMCTKGEWKDDKRNGRGVYRYHNNDVYDGEWKDDAPNGEGVYRSANNDVYEGQINDGKCYGRGVYRYANGDVYNGEWENNMKNGKGIMNYHNGDVYDGEWYNDKRIESLKDGDLMSSICLGKKADHCFVPCGHICICEYDAERIKTISPHNCPMCRTEFTNIIKTFPVGEIYKENESKHPLMPPTPPPKSPKTEKKQIAPQSLKKPGTLKRRHSK